MTNQFMQRAIELSLKNIKENRGGPFGAVIVKDNKIIAEGTNLVTSTNDTTAHAEITAIRSACKVLNNFHLNGCQMYTSCEPCPMCLGAAYWANLEKIFYANTKHDAAKIGFDDSFIYDQLNKPYESRKIPMINTPNNAAIEAFTLWAGKQDKIPY